MNQKHISPIHIVAAVITVSSTRTRENDTSGSTINELFKKAGIPVAHYNIVPDQIEIIRSEVYQSMSKSNCIVINGGTGLTHDDCTIEAVLPLIEKKIDGFGELFRLKSYQEIGTSSMLSRALAGICHKRAIFCIPGSTPAVTLATNELIIPEIAHILSHANK
ncbi:MAG TPA: molybdenum cofactor biosynthesis protein B [Methanoregula sp.]|nr:molybdenum cofactor biosynthesis protein B [Methanoregula sp.]